MPRCVWSRNIKNGCSIYIYNISRLRVKSSGVERQCHAKSAEHSPSGAFALLSYLDIKFVPYIYTVLNILTNSMWFTYLKCDFHGSVHRKYFPIYIQQDATLHSLFISGNCSTCFRWYHHPLSGAHTTVSTASGIFTATCPLSWKIWNCGTALQFQPFHDSGR